MPTTSQFGKTNSRLGNIVFGGGGSAGNVYNGSASDTLSFSETWTGYNLHQSISETITFSEVTSGFTVTGSSTDTLNLNETLTRTAVFVRSLSDTLTFTEISGQVFYGSASDTLVFSDVASGVRNLSYSASDVLTLTESLTRALTANRTVSEALVFTEQLRKNVIRLLNMTESLNFSDVMAGVGVKVARDIITFSENLTNFVSKLIKDTMDLGDLLSVNVRYVRTTADVLEMFDRISVELYLRRALTDTLSFSDGVAGQRTTPSHDTVTFSENISAVNSKLTTDSLTLTDIAATVKIRTVSTQDLLSFVDNFGVNMVLRKILSESLNLLDSLKWIRVRFFSITDTVAFTDTVYREIRVALAPDTLSLIENWVVKKIAPRSVSDTLIFSETLTLHTVLFRNISDIVHFKDAGYGVVADKMMILIGRDRSIVLPPPEFNDFYTDRNQVIFKRKMGGDVTTYIKTCPEQKLHYEFLISKPKANEFRDFLDSENSNPVTIYDWKGEIWSVKLLTDAVDKEEIGRWEPCGNKTRVTVEFIGRRYA
jgi:hypothetical protein